MVVGVLKITLAMHGNRSLKDKRRILSKIKDKVRNNFNISIAEIENQDAHAVAVLGCAVVSAESAHADSQMANTVSFIENMFVAEIAGYSTELIHIGAEDYDYDEDV